MTDMKHRSLTNDPPKVGDPVVFDGTKYRIRVIGAIGAILHDRFGGTGAPEPVVLIDSLYWDPLPGVWRVER